MPGSKQSILRWLLADNSGAEIAEAAAVLPLMFTILLGIFWFGQAFSIYGAITRAAQEGARAGAAPTCSTCTSGATPATNAWATVQSNLSAANLDPTKTQQVQPSLISCSSGTAASCDAANTNICVQSPVQITTTSSGGTGVCGVAVTFQYPYQFWLPFTTLNKQQIWMTASARVRIETQ